MSKFYVVLKDTPLWEKGAILKQDKDEDGDGGYSAISDLWDAVEHSDWLTKRVVEKSSKWFKRVYAVVVGKKTIYKSRTEAKKAFAEEIIK